MKLAEPRFPVRSLIHGLALAIAILLSLDISFAETPCALQNAQLAGLWSKKVVFGPLAEGVLTIDGRTADWKASISGFGVNVQHQGNHISFALPANEGAFAGSIQPDGQIAGRWTQPIPVRSLYPFVSRVQLANSQPGVWIGTVRPLRDQITMYMSISVGSDSALTAYFRDSEIDLEGGKSYSVRCDGSALTFVNKADPKDVISGKVDASAKQLSLRLNLGDAAESFTFDFVRISPDAANEFFASVPASALYVYRHPLMDGDG
jgi:hypothetical protein